MNDIVQILLEMESEDMFVSFEQVFLFGSAISSTTPNDIDVILVYQEKPFEEVHLELGRISEFLANKLVDYDLDFTVFTKSELQTTNFLYSIQFIRIKG